MHRSKAALAALLVIVGGPLLAQYAPPKITEGVRIDQKLNAPLPQDLPFKDDAGRSVTLRQYLGQGKPVVFALVYYRCPSLCNLTLTSMVKALNKIALTPSKDYEVVAVSIDPAETPQLASEKKSSYSKESHRNFFNEGWHFLTGPQLSISRVAEAVGFRYRYDERTKQFVHAAGIMVVTPDGRVSKYFYGEQYAPTDVRLALVDSSKNGIGTAVDQALLFCFHYDFAQGKYTLQVVKLLQIFGIATVLALAVFIVRMQIRDKKLSGKQETGKEVEHVH